MPPGRSSPLHTAFQDATKRTTVIHCVSQPGCRTRANKPPRDNHPLLSSSSFKQKKSKGQTLPRYKELKACRIYPHRLQTAHTHRRHNQAMADNDMCPPKRGDFGIPRARLAGSCWMDVSTFLSQQYSGPLSTICPPTCAAGTRGYMFSQQRLISSRRIAEAHCGPVQPDPPWGRYLGLQQ